MKKLKYTQNKQIKSIAKATKFALITDNRYSVLLKIFKDKCIGEVSLYADEENGGLISGEFMANKKSDFNYEWSWANKIFYTYSRLTDMIGHNDGYEDAYFENNGEERIYIFENLNDDDFEIISHIIKEHHLIFKCNEESIPFIKNIANATHNYYSTYERVAMKFHPFCDDYNKYLEGAKLHLAELKKNINAFSEDQNIQNDIDNALLNIENFMHDKKIRDFLLNMHKSHFEVLNEFEVSC